MQQITLIRKTLQETLPWHGARLTFLAQFLIALFRVKTVNLAELATGFAGTAQTATHYKRLQRFFCDYVFEYVSWVKLIQNWIDEDNWQLSIDRTQWQLGKSMINILMLAVVHRGVAIPIFWLFLPNRGNSYTWQRIELLKRLRTILPEQKIDFLTSDREFIGKQWLSYLLGERIPFRARIREKEVLDDGHSRLPARVVFQHLQVGETQVLAQRRLLWGSLVWVSALRLQSGELLIVATDHAQAQAIADYALRWQIETLFGCFKSRGFCLEDTHMLNPARLSKLLALLTLALCWAIRTGEWVGQLRPFPLKKHGRKAKSVFRFGLDYLRSILLNLDHRFADFKFVLQFLSCT